MICMLLPPLSVGGCLAFRAAKQVCDTDLISVCGVFFF